MASVARPVQHTWPTSLAVGVALGWFAILALAMWIGSNDPRPIQAWFVAYPMFALYPGVAGLAASRARSPGVVVALATLIPMVALWLALLPAAVDDTPFGVRDDRVQYALVTLVSGLGLLVAIRTGARVMRRGANRSGIQGGGVTVPGFAVAGVIFLAATAIAFYPVIILTT